MSRNIYPVVVAQTSFPVIDALLHPRTRDLSLPVTVRLLGEVGIGMRTRFPPAVVPSPRVTLVW